MKKQGSSRAEKGQSMVELGVSLVFILVLLAGTVDVGRALFTYMDLREAAQEGALYGSIYPTDTSGIATRVQGAATASGITSNSFNINVSVLGSPCTGNGIRVDVAINNFPITTPFLGAVIGTQTVAISASATDTILSPACT
jgi:Flp pilus assembly protein TadG